jgi:hypothetical protein
MKTSHFFVKNIFCPNNKFSTRNRDAEFNLEVHHPDERPPREFETQGTSWDGG